MYHVMFEQTFFQYLLQFEKCKFLASIQECPLHVADLVKINVFFFSLIIHSSPDASDEEDDEMAMVTDTVQLPPQQK